MNTTLRLMQEFREGMIELEALTRQLERSGTAGRPRGVTAGMADSGVRGTNDPLSAMMQQMDGLEEMIAERRQALSAMQGQVSDVIASARDWRVRFILLHYYTMGETDERIGLVLHLSTRHICRLRNGFFADMSNGGRPRHTVAAPGEGGPCMSHGTGV